VSKTERTRTRDVETAFPSRDSEKRLEEIKSSAGVRSEAGRGAAHDVQALSYADAAEEGPKMGMDRQQTRA